MILHVKYFIAQKKLSSLKTNIAWNKCTYFFTIS
jgi:hypothetical protein